MSVKPEDESLANTVFKIWVYGWLVMIAYVVGVATQSGTSGEIPVAAWIGIGLGALWSLGVWLVALGYKMGKRSKARQSA